eukprot:s451_g14.t1
MVLQTRTGRPAEEKVVLSQGHAVPPFPLGPTRRWLQQLPSSEVSKALDRCTVVLPRPGDGWHFKSVLGTDAIEHPCLALRIECYILNVCMRLSGCLYESTWLIPRCWRNFQPYSITSTSNNLNLNFRSAKALALRYPRKSWDYLLVVQEIQFDDFRNLRSAQ